MAETQISTLTLRHMTTHDIADVIVIDRASFIPAWTARSYQFEITESHVSHMVVLERSTPQPVQGIKRLLYNLRGQEAAVEEQRSIVGYGGMWKIQEEAHISTIASHPQERGRGYGEVVLAGMIRRAILLEAGYIVLEVRVSNAIAQKLYRKYHFQVTGVRENYYRHNNEDAYEMRLDLTDSATLLHLNALYEAVCARHGVRDQYASTPHPRLGF